MGNSIRILLSLFAFAYLSCSSNKADDPSNFLKMDFGKSNAVLIPAPSSTRSCEQQAKGDVTGGGITGSYFSLPNPKIEWTGDQLFSEIRMVVFKLTLKSPKIGGEYSCIFSDTGIKMLYYKSETVSGSDVLKITPWDGIFGFANSNFSTKKLDGFTPCEIRCGGMTIPKNAGTFSVTGDWELIAVQKKYSAAGDTNSEYEEFPIKVTGSFTVENALN